MGTTRGGSYLAEANSACPLPTSDLKASGRTALARTCSSPVVAGSAAPSCAGGLAPVRPRVRALPTLASCTAMS